MVLATLPTTVPRRKLSADEFQGMIRAGILCEGEHVELLNGELIQMAAISGSHANCVTRINNRITPRVAGRALVSVQSSLRLSNYSEPEPDIAVIRDRDYGDSLPRADDVLLIIEVADTTLRYDRGVKLPLYAAEGIPEVWIADVRRKRLTVYRDPTFDGYRQVITLTRRATIAPLAFPDLELRWESVFGEP